MIFDLFFFFERIKFSLDRLHTHTEREREREIPFSFLANCNCKLIVIFIEHYSKSSCIFFSLRILKNYWSSQTVLVWLEFGIMKCFGIEEYQCIVSWLLLFIYLHTYLNACMYLYIYKFNYNNHWNQHIL